MLNGCVLNGLYHQNVEPRVYAFCCHFFILTARRLPVQLHKYQTPKIPRWKRQRWLASVTRSSTAGLTAWSEVKKATLNFLWSSHHQMAAKNLRRRRSRERRLKCASMPRHWFRRRRSTKIRRVRRRKWTIPHLRYHPNRSRSRTKIGSRPSSKKWNGRPRLKTRWRRCPNPSPHPLLLPTPLEAKHKRRWNGCHHSRSSPTFLCLRPLPRRPRSQKRPRLRPGLYLHLVVLSVLRPRGRKGW